MARSIYYPASLLMSTRSVDWYLPEMPKSPNTPNTPKAPRLTISLLVVALGILANGCGSTEDTTSTSVAASAPAATTQATGQSSTPAAAQPTGTSAQTAPQTNPEHKTTAPTPSTKAAKPKSTTAETPQAPPRYFYPAEPREHFIAACTAAKGSKLSCECIIFRYESRKVEEGQSLAELLGVTLALTRHFRLNQRARQYASECHSAMTSSAA